MFMRNAMAAATAVFAAMALGSPGPAAASPSPPPSPRLRLTPATPDQVRQAEALRPLDRLASAAMATGGRDFTGHYAGTRLQADVGKVEVFLTDTAQGSRFLTALRKQDPGAEADRLVIKPAKYSEQQLTTKSNLIMARARQGKLPFAVHATFLPPDGSGLTVEVSDPQQARRILASKRAASKASADTEVFDGAVTIARGDRKEPLSGRVDFPWLAGAGLNITAPGHGRCTSGLPWYDKVTQVYYILTAFHCFDMSSWVGTLSYTGLGQVTGFSKPTDSEMIKVSRKPSPVEYENGVPEEDGGSISGKTITGWGDVAANTLVCQNGFTSFANGKGVPCDWKTTGRTQYNLTAHGVTYTVNAMKAVQQSSKATLYKGDSGAAVFVLSGAYAVKGVGMVSAGSGGGCSSTATCTNLMFTTMGDLRRDWNNLTPMTGAG